MSNLSEIREKASEVAKELRELREIPESKRSDSFAVDVRNKTAELNALDAEEKRLAAEERAKWDALAWERAVQEDALRQLDAARQLVPGSNGPTGAFADLHGHRNVLDEITEHPEYREWVESGARGRMPDIVLEGRSLHEVRTLLDSTTDGGSPGVLLPQGQPIAPVPRMMRFFVRDVIPVTPTTLAAIPYVRELNPATTEIAATGVEEGASKPEATMTFESDTAVVCKIAAWIPATMEILADAPTLRGYINGRLVYMLKFREEQQILNGAGTDGQLKGILQFSPQTAGATDNEAFIDFATAIGKVENVDGEANGIAMNPLDYWDQIATRRSTFFDGNASNQGGAPFDAPTGTVWGLPVIRTRALTSLTAIVADWRGAMIFDRMEATVRQSDSHSDYFVKNKVAILAEERVALAVFRPDYFVNTTIDITPNG